MSLDTVKNVTSAANISVFAAGGINLENILLVLEAGVDGVAVTSAILKSKDPEQTARAFKQVIEWIRKKVIEDFLSRFYFLSSDRTKFTISSAMLTFATTCKPFHPG